MRQNGSDQRTDRVAPRRDTRPPPDDAPADAIGRVLRDYEARGLIRKVRAHTLTANGVEFDIVWNDRLLRIVFHSRKASLTMPDLLTNVPADTPMYREFAALVRGFRSSKLAPHRRLDAGKAAISHRNRNGSVAVLVTVRDGDAEYATRQLLRIVHEVLVGFLNDPQYSEYEYAEFGVNRWI